MRFLIGLLTIFICTIHKSAQLSVSGASKSYNFSEVPKNHLCRGKNNVFVPVPGSIEEFYYCADSVSIRVAVPPQNELSALGINEDVCLRAANTGALFAVPRDCSRYYICLENRVVVRSCGDFHFNPDFSACVSGGCPQPGGQYKPSPKPYIPQTNDQMCNGKQTGETFPDRGNCSQYIYCWNNNAVTRSCGEMHFNSKIHLCQDPKIAGCAGNVIDPSTIYKPCYGKPSGKKLEDIRDPQRYILCLNGHAFEEICPSNYYFDMSQQDCIPYYNQGNENNNMQKDFICEGEKTGHLLSHHSDCGKYIVCHYGKAVEMLCPLGLNFNPKLDICDFPENAQCVPSQK